jgi:hypothetical protein
MVGTETTHAIFVALRLVLTGIIGGLAFAIALIMQEPIKQFVISRGISDPLQLMPGFR